MPKRTLFFDAFNGVAGDMVLGALVDLGVSPDDLQKGLRSLALEPFEIRAETVSRQGLVGIDVKVITEPDRELPGDGSKPGSKSKPPYRNLRQILEMIAASELPQEVQKMATSVFSRLGEAEAKVHGSPLEKVHFHEVGALDSIVDIVGSCLGFQLLGVERFFSSPLALGGGTVHFSHGHWPVPAPATEHLVRGFPSRLGPVDFELTTPTGAAIVTTLARPSSEMPVWVSTKSGLGAGDRTFDSIPNMLRLILGEISPSFDREPSMPQDEEITVLEASIDNMDPEALADFQDLSLSQGALDVYYATLHMKKGRPGVLLTILCRNEDCERLARLAFRETTTLGIRWRRAKRWILDRECVQVETSLGSVTVKLGRFQGRLVNIWPEYQELRQLATSHGIPLKLARRKVFEALKDLNHE